MTTAALPSPVDRVLADYIARISARNPTFVEGVYLTGSIPLRDFFRKKSDIDFIVLCRTFPDKQLYGELQSIHKTIASKYKAPQLSGTYMATDNLRTDAIDNIKALNYHEGKLRYDTLEMAPIVLAELKRHAITVYGQDALTLPIEISREEVKVFLHDNINSYWKQWADDHISWWKKRMLLVLFPRLTEWSVLGIARQLVTMQTGDIVSKTDAGLYCLQHLPEKFHSIIYEALLIRKDERTYPIVQSYAIRPSLGRATRTIECLLYLIETINLDFQPSMESV